MDFELNPLLNGIKEKTGIDVVVYTDGFKFIATTDSATEILQPSQSDFDGIFQDVTTGNTYFKVKYKNLLLTGFIKGVTKIEKNYATLICDLIESAPSRDLELSQAEYLKTILQGDCNRAQIQKYEKKYSVPQKQCFVLAIQTQGAKKQDLLNVLTTFGAGESDYAVVMEENLCAFVKFVDDSISDYQSSTDFAGFLTQSIKEETGVTVSVGVGATVKDMAEISTSYQQAVTAVRMASIMGSKGQVHSFKEYMLLTMLKDISKAKLNEYLDTLLDTNAREIFADIEMTNTAEEFLENSLNVSETSRKLYLHRNTLMYRLDKIERETGFNIRKFSDAVIFRLITILFKLTK
jgi:carbohydrate diacid regulator